MGCSPAHVGSKHSVCPFAVSSLHINTHRCRQVALRGTAVHMYKMNTKSLGGSWRSCRPAPGQHPQLSSSSSLYHTPPVTLCAATNTRQSSSSSSGGPKQPWQQRSAQPKQRPPADARDPKRSNRASSRRQQQQEEDDQVLGGEFLSNAEASRLRRLLQTKGREAVVDEQGYVKVPVGREAAAAAAAAGAVTTPPTSGGRVSRAGATTPAPDTDPNSSSSSSRGSSEPQASQQLQPEQQQQQQVASLPIVRPNDGDKGTFFSLSSWKRLGASPAVQAALQQLGITRPSHIQAESYPLLLSDAPAVALADQAGSGKTLAYLLPLLQQLKQAEAAAGGRVSQPGSPSILILTPTVELAGQVRRVLKALSDAGLRCRSIIATGGQGEAADRAKAWRTQVQALAGGVDVLVAGPGRAAKLAAGGHLNLKATQALVLDEVDVLCANDYQDVIAPLREAAPDTLRCVLVSATLPQHTMANLQQLFPGLKAAFGPGLHRTAVGLTEELVDCSGGEVSLEVGTLRKLEALDQALSRHKAARALVFCNKLDTCRRVENHLLRAGVVAGREVLPYHEAVRDDIKRKNLEAFLAPPSSSHSSRPGSQHQQQQKQVVLVCTDRTSRGIDSMFCEHVVLFDFPRDPSEYVRRVGRTARGAGGKGVVSILVLGKQVPLAQEIISRGEKGVPVHRVPDLM